MRKHVFAVSTIVLNCFLLCVLLPLSTNLRAQSSDKLPADTLVLMTYNLRYSNSTPSEAWTTRRLLMGELIKGISPDIMGTQEGLYPQIKDLATDMPDYEWIGLGRNGGSRSEFMAIFFRKSRLEPLEYDHFWLSDTPDVMGSSTWGNSNRRMVTWVKFHDRKTQREFYYWNTHFDHQIQPAREKSAELVRKRIEALNTKLPVILGGDFNAAAGKNKAYEILTGDGFFTDTMKSALERKNEDMGTFNGFKALQPNGPRIDWILTRGDVVAHKIEIVTFARDGKFPSDHCPVVAWVSVGKN
jgi:endonuclease/exonuclease/phosphatase family metal-dependent hydrolase